MCRSPFSVTIAAIEVSLSRTCIGVKGPDEGEGLEIEEGLAVDIELRWLRVRQISNLFRIIKGKYYLVSEDFWYKIPNLIPTASNPAIRVDTMKMAKARNPFFGKPHILMGGVTLVRLSACWVKANASGKESEYII